MHHIPETAASRRSRGVWWAMGLLALSGLWIFFCACVYLTGYTASVTVTGGDGAPTLRTSSSVLGRILGADC